MKSLHGLILVNKYLTFYCGLPFQMTVSKLDVPLPIAMPIEQDGTIPALQNLDIWAIVKKCLNDIRECSST